MEGFQKIDLQSKDNETAIAKEQESFSDMRKKKGNNPKNTKIILTIVGAILLFIILAVILPGIFVIKNAKATFSDAKVMYEYAKYQNVQLVSDNLNKTKADLLNTQSALRKMIYLKFIPPFNFYYNDADHLVNAGLYALDGGRVLVDSVTPYADVLGLKGTASFSGGSAEQRIQTAVTTLSKITPNIDKISVSLDNMKSELDQVSPGHYPSIFGLKKINDQLTQARTAADYADAFVKQATPLIKVLPSQLGEPQQKRYLILFQNNAELRSTGGFISAYSIMRFEHGVFHSERADDIYTLDATIPNKPTAPAPILKYLPNVPTWNLRDTNLSPDFVESMKAFNNLYAKAGGAQAVDGIIAIDTKPMVDAIDVLGGEIQVDGVTMSTKTNQFCHCADVIYQLEQSADQPVGYVKQNRKGLIGDLMISIIQKALSSKPKIYWGPLFQAFINDTAQKHILFDVNNSDAQIGIEALNAAGRILSFDGDYLHINDVNFGGAKSNLYVSEAVDQNYNIKSDGTIEKTVTIHYKNPYPPSDCNLEHGNLCLNAILRDWLRIYVPKGSEMINSQGSEVKMSTSEELGKTMFEGFLTVRPLGTATFTITYRLPFKLAGGSGLPAMYQKQPGTNDNQYTISVNGRQINQFPLLQDKTIKINP